MQHIKILKKIIGGESSQITQKKEGKVREYRNS